MKMTRYVYVSQNTKKRDFYYYDVILRKKVSNYEEKIMDTQIKLFHIITH